MAARTVTDIDSDLEKKLPMELITTLKEGPARGAPYLETWIAIEQANRIFGFGGWTTEVKDLKCILTYPNSRGNELAVYQALIKVTAHGVWHEDVGIGIGSSAQVDMAVKGAVSDGMKRALRCFGPQFGNELYDKQQSYLDVPEEQQRQPDTQPQGTPPQGNGNRAGGSLLQEALNAGGVPVVDEPQGAPQIPADAWSLWPATSVAMFHDWARAYAKDPSLTNEQIYFVISAFWNVNVETGAEFAEHIGKTRGRIAIMQWADRNYGPDDAGTWHEASQQQKVDPMPEADGPRNGGQQ